MQSLGGTTGTRCTNAAQVGPKNPSRTPFALPDANPWDSLSRWDAGEADLPAPGPATWFAPTVARLGDVTDTTTRTRWSDLPADGATATPFTPSDEGTSDLHVICYR